MRILIVHPCKGFYGGAEEVVVQLSNYLTDKGHRVVIATKDTPDRFYQDLRNTDRVFPFEAGDWFLFRQNVASLIKRQDVICCFNFPATLATFPARKPIVWYCNEPPEYFTNWWRKPLEAFNRWWVRKSGMKVVVADQMNAHRFFRLYGIEPSMVPYGVDYEYWSGNPGVERFEDPVILQVGHKEFFPVGEAVFSEVKKKIPNVQLVQLWNSSHEVVREKYHEASILLHPVKSQGGWLVPFEAMSAGLPVVTTLDFCGSSLVSKLGGSVVPYMADEMAFEVCSILERPSNNQKVRKWIRNNLTWEKFGEAMVKIFEEVTQ